jgi:hypothetical protein
LNKSIDACINSYKDSLIRAIVIDSSYTNTVTYGVFDNIIEALGNSGIQNLPNRDQSIYIIIEYNKKLKYFSVLYSEVINTGIVQFYSTPTVLINGILWSFLSYQYDGNPSLQVPIISYDLNSYTIGHHIFRSVYSNTYSVETVMDLPRLIVNEEKEIAYIVLVNRDEETQGFTGAAYTFTELNHHNHISNSQILQYAITWNTSIPQGTGYYLGLSININGYILKNKLYIDIFNGNEGEVSYTTQIAIQENGHLDQQGVIVKVYDNFIHGYPLKNSVLFKTFKDGVIQGITGYKKTIYNGETIVEPIIAIDSHDVLYDSSYTKVVRTFVLLDAMSMEIPKAIVSFPRTMDEEYLLVPSGEGIEYIKKDSDGIVNYVMLPESPGDKYKNFRKLGFSRYRKI